MISWRLNSSRNTCNFKTLRLWGSIERMSTNEPQRKTPPRLGRFLSIFWGIVTKFKFLKSVASNAMKDNPFPDSEILISDDVSKNACKDRAKLRRDYLKGIKEFKEVVLNLHSYLGRFRQNLCSRIETVKHLNLSSFRISKYVQLTFLWNWSTDGGNANMSTLLTSFKI